MSKPKNSKEVLEFVHRMDTLAIQKLKEENARLKAEVERLKLDAYKKLSMRIEIDKLKAQIEYLTNAGNGMANAINGDYNHELPCVEEWNAAKEGKPKNSKDALEFIHTLDSLAIKKQKEEIERLCAWGRGLESDLSHARVEISFLKAEVERLKEDNRQLTKAFEIAEGIIKRMGKAAEDAAKEGKPSV